jgi:hypothetical protein
MSVYPLQARITVPDLPGGARYRVRELMLGEESGRDLGILTAETLAWAGFQGDPRRPDHGRLFHFLPIR